MRRAWVLGLSLLLAGCRLFGGNDEEDDGGDLTEGTVTGQLTPYRGAGLSAEAAGVWQEHGAQLRAAARRALGAKGRPQPALVAARAPAQLPPSAAREVVPGEFIVRFEGEAPRTAQAVADRLGLAGYAVQLRASGAAGMRLVHVAPDGLRAQATPSESPEAFAERIAPLLAARPGVRWAEPNLRMRAFATPDDRFFSLQWHYTAMNLPAAWDLTTGSAGVTVAVLDTGITPHPDLPRVGTAGGRVLAGYDFVSDPANAGDGDGRDATPTDEGGDEPNGGSSWHGTHVAGTLGAATDNGSGVAAVDWRARVLPVRVLGRQGGSSFDIAAAMEWAAGGSVEGVPRNDDPAQVVNLSLGGEAPPQRAYQEVIDRHPNTVFVVAAGNEGVDAASTTPCNQQNVVCVGSVAYGGRRSSFSNFGAVVDVMAPGGEMREDLNGDGRPDGILSTYRDDNGQPVYAFLQGTSMATPHVAGLVALMVAARRANRPNATLSATEALAILQATASPTPDCPEGCGAGLVNAQAAVRRAAGASTSGPARLDVTTTELFFMRTTTLNVSVANQGGQPLTVTASATGPEAARLSFPSGTQLTVAAGSIAPLAVNANLEGLAAGDYTASVVLDAGSAGRATVPVRIRVSALEDKDAVIAFAYRDALGEWQVDDEGVGRVPAADGYRYRIQLTPRTYYALATIDDDGDGEFFEEGERTGFWRNQDDFEPIVLAAGQTIDGISFDLVPLAPVSSVGPDVGSPCGEDGDCPGGLCLTAAQGFPGGYCSLDCSSAACPASSACYALGSAQDAPRRCLERCTGAGTAEHSCRTPDYVCYPDGAGSAYCAPACKRDPDCGTGETCDANGYCRAP